LIEINITQAIDLILETIQTAGVQWARNKIKEKIFDFLTDRLLGFIEQFIPFNSMIAGWEAAAAAMGTKWMDKVEELFCDKLGIPEVVWFAATIMPDGDVWESGYSCSKNKPPDKSLTRTPALAGHARPDFIISTQPPDDDVNSLMIGDIKLSVATIFTSYFAPGAKQENQWLAIANFAREHTYTRFALFICARQGNKSAADSARVELNKRAIGRRIFVYLAAPEW
jgi:hypothetical protein